MSLSTATVMATQTPPPQSQANGTNPVALAETTWLPFDIFSSSLPSQNRFALIALNQPLSLPSSIYPILWKNAHARVGADGGANRVHRLNTVLLSKSESALDLDTVIGDLDSLFPKTRKYWAERGAEIIQDTDQYSTDLTKAVTHLRSSPLSSVPNGTSNGESKSHGSGDIVVLGGLGGRVDQGLSVLHHLYMFQSAANYSEGRMYLLSSEAITILLQPGKHRIRVKEKDQNIGLGTHIGIIPMREPAVISTQGLEWDVQDWETSFGGQMSTSNLVREEWVSIETDKGVLFTIDLDLGEEEGAWVEGE